jgi:predicted CDP-diglyceride synthetase/phosphatidate cytidylyltransferase
MRMLLIVGILGIVVFSIFASISMIRYRNKMTPIEREHLDQRPMSWWYIFAVAVAITLMIGKFNELATFIGYFILIVTIGLKWKSGIERR